MGIFKSRQVAIKITPYLSHFAGCSRVCRNAHILFNTPFTQSKIIQVAIEIEKFCPV